MDTYTVSMQMLIPVLVIAVTFTNADALLSNFIKHEQVECPDNAYSEGGAQMTVKECALICQATEECTFVQYDPPNTEAPCWMRYGCEPKAFLETCTTYEKVKSAVQLSHIPDGMVKMENKDCNGGDKDYFMNIDENICIFQCLMTNCMTVTWMTESFPQRTEASGFKSLSRHIKESCVLS